MKTLIVDDSRTMRNILKRVVVDVMGHSADDVSEAADGVEALAQIDAGAFDLYLVDWNMPNMDGLELLKSLRGRGDKTPFIMCTTEGEKARVVEAIRSGANNYVVKPMTAEVVQQKIEETLAKCGAQT